MTADPGAYNITADDVAEDRAVERDQECRVLGAPADYLRPGEFEAATRAARRGVFAGMPHGSVEDMTRAAIRHVAYRPQVGSPDWAMAWLPAIDRLVALDEALNHDLRRHSDEFDRLVNEVLYATAKARETAWPIGGDAA